MKWADLLRFKHGHHIEALCLAAQQCAMRSKHTLTWTWLMVRKLVILYTRQQAQERAFCRDIENQATKPLALHWNGLKE
jgi:hypothetical protein